eukprot:TRINITY_DN105509_c0_g1_i1.p1 TRINITY_DN105509_c0_g1~~TRINITY_DN105509_c0_g1_i1.p1  ORF type:complete len:434 (+),score=117.53 TRINITY_DN105509_c0_g1_i1:31-1302(+)
MGASCQSQAQACELHPDVKQELKALTASVSECSGTEISCDLQKALLREKQVRSSPFQSSGFVESVESVSDLKQSKFANLNTKRHQCGQSKVDLFDETLEGDSPVLLRCSARAVAEVADENQEDDHWVQEDMRQAYGGLLEFMAKAELESAAPRITVFCNGKPLDRDLQLSGTYKIFRFDCPAEELVESVAIGVEGELFTEGHMPVVQLEQTFGLRLRGHDILPRLCVRDEAEEEVSSSALVWAAEEARWHGRLLALPPGHCYSACLALEFLVSGASGSECLDVYINGLTVPCETDITVGVGAKQQQRLRYAILPVSCDIRSLVFRVRLPGGAQRQSGAQPEVLIDSDFGVRVAGQNCLSSAVLVDPKTCLVNPQGWSFTSQEQQDVKVGRWKWDGYYYLRPYRRVRKPHARRAPSDRSEELNF